MKNIAGVIAMIVVLSACQKEEIIPVQNQISFMLDGKVSNAPMIFTGTANGMAAVSLRATSRALEWRMVKLSSILLIFFNWETT